MSDSGTAAQRGPTARREQIRRAVLAEGYARVEDLARDFDVSLMTVHRDLDQLEADGWLTKIRGGATANPSALVDAGVRERGAAMPGEKLAITTVAAELLVPGQSLFLDDSTTALGLVPWIAARPPMTVATNFLPAVTALGDTTGVEVHLLGGEYHPRQEACFGLQTVEAINRLHADLFLMSTTAISDGRCLHRSEATVMVRKACMRNATRSVLLVDHAKFGRPAPHVLCDVADFDVVIVDDGIDPEDLAELRERVREVQVAPVSPGEAADTAAR